MDKEEIRAIVVAEKNSAMGSSLTSDLNRQRADALDYYLGDISEHMPSIEGQSRVASSDVSDVIESVMPSLMDIFTSSGDYIEFTPTGPEDVEAARQETDYVNHVFMNENDGFMVLYSFIKDALLSKNGIIKVWWEEAETAEKETYRGLDEAAYSFIVADDENSIVQQTIGENGIDVVVSRRSKKGRLRIAPVPPEEFGISTRARDIPSSSYCYHRFQMSRSELIEQGYPRDVVDSLPTSSLRGVEHEEYARNTTDDYADYSVTINNSMQLIDVTEHYIRLDVDGDGIAELIKVVTAGGSDVLLGDPEEFDRMPFHSITPFPMTHRFYGRSVADLCIEIMRIKTHLIRALLDNASLLNNQRIAIGQIGASESTIDDLLTNRPGGVIRMNDVSQLREVPNQSLGGHILPLIEYVDQLREVRTGITRNAGGIDPDAINKAASTATGFQGLMDMSMMRIKMIARIFAETGIKSMFLHIHELLRKHQDTQKVVRLRNNWVPVDPRGWANRADMTINVALGTGGKQQQLMFLNQILERQVQAVQMQGGVNGPLVMLNNIYNTLKYMTELSGMKNVDQYWNMPDEKSADQDESQPDPKMLEIESEMRIEQEKLRLTVGKAEMEMALKERDSALRRQLAEQEAEAKLALEERRQQREYALAQQRMENEMTLARQKMENEILLAREGAVMREIGLPASGGGYRPGGDLSE